MSPFASDGDQGWVLLSVGIGGKHGEGPVGEVEQGAVVQSPVGVVGGGAERADEDGRGGGAEALIAHGREAGGSQEGSL